MRHPHLTTTKTDKSHWWYCGAYGNLSSRVLKERPLEISRRWVAQPPIKMWCGWRIICVQFVSYTIIHGKDMISLKKQKAKSKKSKTQEVIVWAPRSLPFHSLDFKNREKQKTEAAEAESEEAEESVALTQKEEHYPHLFWCFCFCFGFSETERPFFFFFFFFLPKGKNR